MNLWFDFISRRSPDFYPDFFTLVSSFLNQLPESLEGVAGMGEGGAVISNW